MELRLYASILFKRAWISVLLLAVVLGTLAGRPQRPPTYHANMRFVVGITPEPRGDFYTYDRYYTWLTAEYLVDDLAEVIRSRSFAAQVAELSGLPIAPGVIQGATAAGKTHRILYVNIHWGNEAELSSLANATAEILTERAGTFFAQLTTEAAVVYMIDPPQIGIVGPSLRDRMDMPLRLVLALATGIALAFLLDYLDSSVRHREDLASLGVPIMAEIPTRRWWERGLPITRRSP